jgi:hypothetical protein
MTLIADILTAPPDTAIALRVGLWLAALFFLAGGVNQVLGIVDRVRGRYSTEELEKRIKTLESLAVDSTARRRAIYEKIEEMSGRAGVALDNLRVEVKRDVERVQGRFDELLGAVHELKGEIKHLRP